MVLNVCCFQSLNLLLVTFEMAFHDHAWTIAYSLRNKYSMYEVGGSRLIMKDTGVKTVQHSSHVGNDKGLYLTMLKTERPEFIHVHKLIKTSVKAGSLLQTYVVSKDGAISPLKESLCTLYKYGELIVPFNACEH